MSNTDPWGYTCGPLFQLMGSTNVEGNTSDSDFIEGYVSEHLQAGGAVLNVFKLLGIHEQGVLVDLIGNGRPISSGDAGEFPVSAAFDALQCDGWKSKEQGANVITSGFIGYDFGPIRDCDRTIYGIETNVNHLITTIAIKQGPEQRNRATRVRIERSDNGGLWYGVDIIKLVDDAERHEYSIKVSAPSRYWRIRPIEFNGVDKDRWYIKTVEMYDYQLTRIDNIQDEFGFMESRDRDYASESVQMKGYYGLVDSRTELSKFGINMASQVFEILVSFRDTVYSLGRPFVIGDIIELPSEIQYNTKLVPVKKYLEVTDVSWSTEGYTPHWKPTLQRLVAEPILASQETLDIIGDYKNTPDSAGFVDINNDNIQNILNIADTIQNKAHTMTPERGSDTYNIAQIPEEVVADYAEQGIDISKIVRNQRALYVEDGLPPNGLPYTEGDAFPNGPFTGEPYHRLTYVSMNNNIPPRLFKWSGVKNRWIYCETDRRQQYNKIKPSLQQKLTSSSSKPLETTSKGE